MLTPVVLSDFDGTIVTVDTGELILSRFANGDWQIYDEMIDKGEIELEDGLAGQFSLVRATKHQVLDELGHKVRLRPGFKEAYSYLHDKTHFAIISYGMDFVIRHVLEGEMPCTNIRIIAPKARVTAHGIGFVYPKPKIEGSINMKHDWVRYFKLRGKRVTYIGNGSSDFPAIKEADIRFAVEESKLAKMCKKHGVRCTEFSDFRQIIETVADEQ